MDIEIVDFYPDTTKDQKKQKCGTMHIYIPSLDLDVRGILFIQHKNSWVIRMPHKQAIDEGKKVFYPVISFTNIDKMKKLLTQIREKGVKYIQENFSEKKVGKKSRPGVSV